MTSFDQDVHHRTSLRIREVVPDFIESDYPRFAEFVDAYYRFLEQYDSLPIKSEYTPQTGVISVQTGNSTVVGANTTFVASASQYQHLRVGSDTFEVRSVTNNTSLILYDIPTRTYYANTFSLETYKTTRQSAGALRQLPTLHDPDQTIADFVVYFRDTYLRDIPHGESEAAYLIPKILDFYQARGSEESFRFLFRILYGVEIDIYYPRDNVLRLSDGQYEKSSVIKVSANVAYANGSSASSKSLDLRQVVGLTSNARATVLRTQDGYDGPVRTTTLYVGDTITEKVEGAILLNSDVAAVDGRGIAIPSVGTPPEGVQDTIYLFRLVQEDATAGGFIAGETISTLPLDDPLALTTTILGSVRAFTITDGGSGYQIGDLVYPAPGYNGGYGAVGKVEAFSNTEISDIEIVDGGEGYYAGLTLTVDNSGTGGGSGLAAYVSNVSPGNILLSDTEALLLEETTDSRASLETIDYYLQGVGISELISSGVLLGDADWGSGNALSAFYGLSIGSRILDITTVFDVIPVYINGSRVPLGKISALTLTSTGSGYLLGTPTVTAIPTYTPTYANGASLPADSVPFSYAELSPVITVGRIGSVKLIDGGASYATTNTFTVTESLTTSANGTGAVLGMVIGASFDPEGRVIGTRGQLSSDQYLQSIDYYQPFAYVLTVEKNIATYQEAVQKLVHPAGGLLIPRQTITAEVETLVGIETVDVETV